MAVQFCKYYGAMIKRHNLSETTRLADRILRLFAMQTSRPVSTRDEVRH